MVPEILRPVDAASMRPERKAPENSRSGRSPEPSISCFNEAGAKSPGEHRRNPGVDHLPERASMRPERKAPENPAASETVSAPPLALQ